MYDFLAKLQRQGDSKLLVGMDFSVFAFFVRYVMDW